MAKVSIEPNSEPGFRVLFSVYFPVSLFLRLAWIVSKSFRRITLISGCWLAYNKKNPPLYGRIFHFLAYWFLLRDGKRSFYAYLSPANLKISILTIVVNISNIYRHSFSVFCSLLGLGHKTHYVLTFIILSSPT